MLYLRTEENPGHSQTQCQNSFCLHSRQDPTWCLYSCHSSVLNKIISFFSSTVFFISLNFFMYHIYTHMDIIHIHTMCAEYMLHII